MRTILKLKLDIFPFIGKDSLFLLFIKANSYIVIPFNELKSGEQTEVKDAEELLNNLSFLKLYTDFYLGNNPYKLPTLIDQNVDFFALTKNKDKELIYYTSQEVIKKLFEKINSIFKLNFNGLKYIERGGGSFIYEASLPNKKIL